MAQSPEWKPTTTTLGPGSTRPILLRVASFQAALLLATVAAVCYHGDWGFLSIGGTVMTACGILYSARRMFRDGLPYKDEMPPKVFQVPGAKGVLFNFGYVNEASARALDNYYAAIGLVLALLGTFLAGALPFMLEHFAPLH
jgi:hypothetical protein